MTWAWRRTHPAPPPAPRPVERTVADTIDQLKNLAAGLQAEVDRLNAVNQVVADRTAGEQP